MKEYVMTLIGASFLTGILGMICPKTSQKYLRLLCGFCMLAILIAPLPSYLEEADLWLPSVREESEEEKAVYDEIYHQTIAKANACQIEEATKNLLIRDFSMKNEEISVSVVLAIEEEQWLLKKATIGLSGSAILIDPREIAACVENLLHCSCEIVYR